MEYAKDDFFQIKYNTKLNRLQMRKESCISKLCKKIKTHKFLTFIVITLFIFSIVNLMLVNQFFNVLNNL